MGLKKFLSLFEYTALFIKQYSEQQVQQNIYRIAEIKKSPQGLHQLVVQVIGKATVIECTPEEIVLNDRMLEGFSKKDIRAITFFACEQHKKPKYKITAQEFSGDLDTMLFKLKKCDSDEVILKTAGQIALDKNLINNLPQEDVCSVSYAAGYEQSGCERYKNEI